MHDSRGRDDHMLLLLLSMEGRRHEHADLHEARVLDLDTYLRSTNGRIENWIDLADATRDGLIREGVEVNVRSLPYCKVCEIVLVHVANDPDIIDVRDGEEVRRVVERLHT